ncbi:MAG: hypothetical protein ABW223_10585 [Rariglobus sp.]
MKPSVRITSLLVIVVGVILAIALWPRPADKPAAAEPTSVLSSPAHTLPPEEIFRRAFWRQPAVDDRILHGERRETLAETGKSVARWQWFLALRPSRELLRSLRNPETFGLLPVKTGGPIRHWPVEPQPAPAWFPAIESAFDFEVLQSPESGLTVLYNPKKNLLFATDSGSGFAAPVR